MTVQASTIGCGPTIKQLHISALGDPLGRPLGRDPRDPMIEGKLY